MPSEPLSAEDERAIRACLPFDPLVPWTPKLGAGVRDLFQRLFATLDRERARAEAAEKRNTDLESEIARILGAPDYESACDMGKLLDNERTRADSLSHELKRSALRVIELEQALAEARK